MGLIIIVVLALILFPGALYLLVGSILWLNSLLHIFLGSVLLDNIRRSALLHFSNVKCGLGLLAFL